MERRKRYDRYDQHFKVTAIALSNIKDVYIKDVAEALNIHPVMLYRWRQELREGKIVARKKKINIDPKTKSELKRLKHVDRENSILKEELSLLKKAIRFSLERKEKSSNS